MRARRACCLFVFAMVFTAVGASGVPVEKVSPSRRYVKIANRTVPKLGVRDRVCLTRNRRHYHCGDVVKTSASSAVVHVAPLRSDVREGSQLVVSRGPQSTEYREAGRPILFHAALGAAAGAN